MNLDALESLIAPAVGVVAVIPLTALWMAYTRTRSRRVATALLAFGAFFVRGIVITVIHLVMTMEHTSEQLIEFGSDAVIICLFAYAFLQGSVRSSVRELSSQKQVPHSEVDQG